MNTKAQQTFTAFVSAGFTATQVEGDGYGGFNKPGIAGGAGLVTKLTRKLDAGFELQYVQKGSLKQEDPDQGDYNSYKLSLNYLEIPVFVQVDLGKVSFFGGPAIGVLLSHKEETQFGEFNSTYQFKSTDFSIFGGVQYQFAEKWSLRSRFSESLLSIRETPAQQRGIFGSFNGQYNTAIVLTINFHLR